VYEYIELVRVQGSLKLNGVSSLRSVIALIYATITMKGIHAFAAFLVAFLVVDECAIKVIAQETTTCEATNGACTEASNESNLYQDTADMLNVAMHTYGYSCLRKLAKEFPHKFQNVSSILNNHMQPIDATQVVSFARDNKDALLKLNATKEHKGEFSMECSGSLLHLWDEAQSKWEENQVTVAIDTDEVEEELVFMGSLLIM
jgi:hypothetical protein